LQAAIIVFPGSNREQDVRDALAASTGGEPLLAWHGDAELPRADLIVVPGGFSYGDYLRCGAIAAHSPAMRTVRERAAKGVPVLGICNGFQILTEAGLLPGALLRNASLTFVCRNVGLRVESSQSLFTAGYSQGQRLSVPVAHHDGNYFADPATLDRLEERGQIAFRYCPLPGETGSGNPNGSARDIAGIFNESKTVLGLMPHPENAIDPLQGSTDGKALFDGLVQALS
jgi:phosphoribosylformylglycinamidine synthase